MIGLGVLVFLPPSEATAALGDGAATPRVVDGIGFVSASLSCCSCAVLVPDDRLRGARSRVGRSNESATPSWRVNGCKLVPHHDSIRGSARGIFLRHWLMSERTMEVCMMVQQGSLAGSKNQSTMRFVTMSTTWGSCMLVLWRGWNHRSFLSLVHGLLSSFR